MSSAPPGHRLAGHPRASAAQGFGSEFLTGCMQTVMASAGTALCQGPQTCSLYAVRELSARQDQAKVMQSQRVKGKLSDPALAPMHGKS